MEPEDLNSHLDNIINKHNRETSQDFEGLSPEQMHYLLYDPFGAESPLKLRTLNPVSRFLSLTRSNS